MHDDSFAKHAVKVENVEASSEADRAIIGAIRYEYFYGYIGLIFGLLCSSMGSFLTYSGIVGDASFSIDFGENTFNVSRAPPGVVLVCLGAVVAFFSRPKIELKSWKGGGN